MMNIRQIRKVIYIVVSISQSNSDDISNEKASISFPPFLKDASNMVTVFPQQNLSRLLQVGMGSDQILPEVLRHSGSCLVNHSFYHFIVFIIWMLSSTLNREISSHNNIPPDEDAYTVISSFQGCVSVLEDLPKTGLHFQPLWRA